MRLSTDNWIAVATGGVSLIGLVVSIFALKTANDVKEAQRAEDHAGHAATISAVHERRTNTLEFSPTEIEKTLYGGMVIFPSDLHIDIAKFMMPDNKIDFGVVEHSMRGQLFNEYSLKRGKVPKIGSYVRYPVPIGVFIQSSHHGNCYFSANRYDLLLGCDLGPALGGSPEDISIDYLGLINNGPISTDGFWVRHPPWNKPSSRELLSIIEERRVEEIKAEIDSFWQHLQDDE